MEAMEAMEAVEAFEAITLAQSVTLEAIGPIYSSEAVYRFVSR